MKWETIKSGLLIFLVGASIYQTAILWSSPLLTTEPWPGDSKLRVLKVQENRPLQVLSPDGILVHLGNDRHTLIQPSSSWYIQLWGDGTGWLKVLAASPDVKPGVVAEEQVEKMRKQGPAFELLFPVSIPLSNWFELAALEGAPVFNLSPGRVLVFLGQDPRMLLQAGDDWYLFEGIAPPREWAAVVTHLGKTNPVQYQEIPAEVKGIRFKPGVYVPVEPPKLAPVAISGEKRDLNTLIEEFFVDRSVVRKVEEKDGTLILTDGRRGLQVFPSGLCQYTSPRVGNEIAYMDPARTLKLALDFMAVHGGIPEGLSLRKVTGGWITTDSHSFEFSQSYGGIPLVGTCLFKGNESSEAHIKITLDNQRVLSYLRCIHQVNGPVGAARSLIDPLEASVQLVKYWKAEGRVPEEIAGLRPAYFMRETGAAQGVARPVWLLITASGRLYLIDGYSGALLR